jgi:hypothetical protein
MKLTAMFKLLLVILIVAISSPVGAQGKSEKKAKKAKVSAVEGVISYVGQRTITYKYERKGKTRDGVAAIGDQTNIKSISKEKISLKDLQKGDKVHIIYEPNVYKPVHSVQVVGKEEMKKKAKKNK